MNHATLARLSLAVYRAPGEPEVVWANTLPDRLLEHGLRMRGHVDRRDTQAIVVESVDDPHDVAVVFRGTEPLRGVDVHTCLRLMPIQDIHGRVHRGFAGSLDHIYFETRSLLRPNDRVHLSGHSMGGALAVIFASRVIRAHHIASLVTFGCPPCVRPELARMLSLLLNGSCCRYESADIVTMLLRSVYDAPGHLYYITAGKKVCERAAGFVAWADRSRVVWRSLGSRLAALLRLDLRLAFSLPQLIRGHSMQAYADAVTRHPTAPSPVHESAAA